MKNIFNENLVNRNYYTVRGNNEIFTINAANITIMPAKTGGVKILTFEDFLNEMKNCGCIIHHEATKQKKRQSMEYNYVEKYNGRFGKGFKLWTYDKQFKSCVTYFIKPKKENATNEPNIFDFNYRYEKDNLNQYWVGPNT